MLEQLLTKTCAKKSSAPSNLARLVQFNKNLTPYTSNLRNPRYPYQKRAVSEAQSLGWSTRNSANSSSDSSMQSQSWRSHST